jgi:hypothetical protein
VYGPDWGKGSHSNRAGKGRRGGEGKEGAGKEDTMCKKTRGERALLWLLFQDERTDVMVTGGQRKSVGEPTEWIFSAAALRSD